MADDYFLISPLIFQKKRAGMKSAGYSGYWGGVLQQVEKDLRTQLSLNAYKYSCIVIAVQISTKSVLENVVQTFIFQILLYKTVLCKLHAHSTQKTLSNSDIFLLVFILLIRNTLCHQTVKITFGH